VRFAGGTAVAVEVHSALACSPVFPRFLVHFGEVRLWDAARFAHEEYFLVAALAMRFP
jgi:hypothetical protein